MTTDRDHLQHLFRQSSGGTEQIDFKALAKARWDNPKAYWEVARTIETVTADVLEEMLPRDEVPRLTDGTITYRFENVMDDMKIAEREVQTLAASKAATFKALLERLENEDPQFMRDYFENFAHWNVMSVVIPLHVTGVHENLKAWLMNSKDIHIDDVVIGVKRAQDKFLDNEFFPFDHELREVMSNLVSAYVTYKLGDLKKGSEKPSEEDINRLLQLSAEHGLTPYALQIINLSAPIPPGLMAVHNTGCPAFHKVIETDIPTALEFSDLKRAYPTLSDEQKLAFGQKFLNHLSSAYGFHPPPELSHDPQNSSYGGQSVWDAKDKEACFAHPLGKITLREFPQDFELFIHLLSHEFIHSMEDAALYTLNPDFQSWQRDTEGHDVLLGGEDTVKNLRSAALQLSFNSVSNIPAMKGLKSVAYKSGDYYPGEEDPTAPESKEPDIYADQLRERHAYGVQGIIARTFMKALTCVDVARDPLSAVIRGQHGMFAAEELLTTKLSPVIPEDIKAVFSEHLGRIKTDFRQADARETSYPERLRLLSRALLDTQSLAFEIQDAGLMNLDEDKEANVLLNRVYEAMCVTLQGKRILTHVNGQGSGRGDPQAVPFPV